MDPRTTKYCWDPVSSVTIYRLLATCGTTGLFVFDSWSRKISPLYGVATNCGALLPSYPKDIAQCFSGVKRPEHEAKCFSHVTLKVKTQ